MINKSIMFERGIINLYQEKMRKNHFNYMVKIFLILIFSTYITRNAYYISLNSIENLLSKIFGFIIQYKIATFSVFHAFYE